MPGGTTSGVTSAITGRWHPGRQWERHDAVPVPLDSRLAEPARPEAAVLVRAVRPDHGRSRTDRATGQYAGLVQDGWRGAADSELLRSAGSVARLATQAPPAAVYGGVEPSRWPARQNRP